MWLKRKGTPEMTLPWVEADQVDDFGSIYIPGPALHLAFLETNSGPGKQLC